MQLQDRLIITGGAGFIGSQLGAFLLKSGYLASSIEVVDDKDQYKTRRATLPLRRAGVACSDFRLFLTALTEQTQTPSAIFHLGAISNTEERDKQKLDEQNVRYSQTLWNYSTEKRVPFFYASSASTYGNGEFGFDDDPAKIPRYRPLNLYAQSKQDFDIWVLDQIAKKHTPPRWAGFKFFNVYGQGEEHKGSQKSVVWKSRDQLEATGSVRLFKSHNPNFADGEQSRDFVFIGDICKILLHFLRNSSPNGIYNAGSGKARSFKDLVTATATALGVPCRIEYIPTPEALRDQYQYFTQAELSRLRAAGYTEPTTELEQGIRQSLELERELS